MKKNSLNGKENIRLKQWYYLETKDLLSTEYLNKWLVAITYFSNSFFEKDIVTWYLPSQQFAILRTCELQK